MIAALLLNIVEGYQGEYISPVRGSGSAVRKEAPDYDEQIVRHWDEIEQIRAKQDAKAKEEKAGGAVIELRPLAKGGVPAVDALLEVMRLDRLREQQELERQAQQAQRARQKAANDAMALLLILADDDEL